MNEPWKFEPSDPGCGLEQFIAEAIGAASVCWETPEGAGIFDSTKAKAICDAVYERAMSPDGARLGMATTAQIVEELVARLRGYEGAVSALKTIANALPKQDLNYRTVD